MATVQHVMQLWLQALHVQHRVLFFSVLKNMKETIKISLNFYPINHNLMVTNAIIFNAQYFFKFLLLEII